jgi:hypothetical protein
MKTHSANISHADTTLHLDNRSNNSSGGNTHPSVSELHQPESKKSDNNSMNSNFTSISLPIAVHPLKPKQAGNIFSAQVTNDIYLQ